MLTILTHYFAHNLTLKIIIDCRIIYPSHMLPPNLTVLLYCLARNVFKLFVFLFSFYSVALFMHKIHKGYKKLVGVLLPVAVKHM